jgi:hypothetical protein
MPSINLVEECFVFSSSPCFFFEFASTKGAKIENWKTK